MTTTEPMVMVLFDYEEIGIIWRSGGRVVTGDGFFYICEATVMCSLLGIS